MTGLEFRNAVKEYITNEKVSVAEHRKLFSKLKNFAMKTFRKFNDEYCYYIKRKYNADELINSEYVHGVEFHTDEVTFLYWDDSSGCTSSCIDIPIDDFIKWIDNDQSEMQNYIIKHIRDMLAKQIAYDKRKFEYYKEAVEHAEKFLANMDKMKFKDVKKWYDEWIDDAI